MSRSMVKIAVVALAVFAVAACSADSKPAPGTSGNPVPSGSSDSSSSESESSSEGPHTLTVSAAEAAPNTFTFDTAGVQTLTEGDVLITFNNLGTMDHEVRLVKINDGNFSAFRLAVVAGDDVALLSEEIAKSSAVDAGGTSTFGAQLTPGTYALLDLRSAPDGGTFAAHGMVRELTVVAG